MLSRMRLAVEGSRNKPVAEVKISPILEGNREAEKEKDKGKNDAAFDCLLLCPHCGKNQFAEDALGLRCQGCLCRAWLWQDSGLVRVDCLNLSIESWE